MEMVSGVTSPRIHAFGLNPCSNFMLYPTRFRHVSALAITLADRMQAEAWMMPQMLHLLLLLCHCHEIMVGLACCRTRMCCGEYNFPIILDRGHPGSAHSQSVLDTWACLVVVTELPRGSVAKHKCASKPSLNPASRRLWVHTCLLLLAKFGRVMHHSCD